MGVVGIPTQFDVGKNRFYTTWCFYITLAQITAAGDVVTQFSPDFNGFIYRTFWVQGAPVTTPGDAATLNLEVNAADISGGTVSLTSAACTPLGKYIAGSAITGANSFVKGDTISVEAASVTAFAEGNGNLFVVAAGDMG